MGQRKRDLQEQSRGSGVLEVRVKPQFETLGSGDRRDSREHTILLWEAGLGLKGMGSNSEGIPGEKKNRSSQEQQRVVHTP